MKPKTDNSKLWMASLKSGGQVTISQRDYLTLYEYCQNVGLEIYVEKKVGMSLTVKMK